MELARHSDVKMTMRSHTLVLMTKPMRSRSCPLHTRSIVRCTGAAFWAAQRVLTWHKLPLRKLTHPRKNAVSLTRSQTSASLVTQWHGMNSWPLRRRARDSNPQPLTGHFISNEAASHSLTLHDERVIRSETNTAPSVSGGIHGWSDDSY